MKLLISAVEASADRLAAELVTALAAHTQVHATGLAGAYMRAAGVVPLPGTGAPAAVMGLVEVLRKLSTIRAHGAALEAAFDQRPDAFITVDASEFHLPLARKARQKGIFTVCYVSPQLWAWRPHRIYKVAAAYDLLLCLFPFEPALYASTGLDARWVGHPVVDRVGPSRREPGVYAIFPGSRRAEIQRLLPPFLAAVAPLAPRRVLLPLASTLKREDLGSLPPWVEVVPRSDDALAIADRALSKSGTVTLELAMAGIPTVIAHRVHPLTYFIGKLLVKGIRYLSLPNILLDREAVPEFVQHFTPERLSQALRDAPVPPLDALRPLLGPPGVADRAAAAVLGRLRIAKNPQDS